MSDNPINPVDDKIRAVRNVRMLRQNSPRVRRSRWVHGEDAGEGGPRGYGPFNQVHPSYYQNEKPFEV